MDGNFGHTTFVVFVLRKIKRIHSKKLQSIKVDCLIKNTSVSSFVEHPAPYGLARIGCKNFMVSRLYEMSSIEPL